MNVKNRKIAKHLIGLMLFVTFNVFVSSLQAQQSISITVNPRPTAYAVGASATSYCAGGSGVDITLADSDIGIDYQLQKGGVDEGAAEPGTGSGITWSNMTNGVYTIIATNTTTSCTRAMTGSQTITIDALPTADAGVSPGDITCANPTRQLTGTGGGTYAWSGGTIDSGANTATPTISAGGTYSLTVTSATGCVSTNSATVVVGSSGTIPGVATITANSRCGTGTVLMTAGIGANGDRVDFSIDGGTSLTASDATSAYEYTTASITAGNTVTVHVRTYNTGNGCASAWTNSAVATAHALPTANLSLDDATICDGEATNLNIALTGTANWTVKYEIGGVPQTDITGITTSPETISINPSANTTYEVTEVSDANCTTTY